MCYKLRSINFVGNPAAEVPGYREHVRRILPQVEVLDNVPFLNDGKKNIFMRFYHALLLFN